MNTSVMKKRIMLYLRMFLLFGVIFFLLNTSILGDFSNQIGFRNVVGGLLFLLITVIVEGKFLVRNIFNSLMVFMLFSSLESIYAGNISGDIIVKSFVEGCFVIVILGVMRWLAGRDVRVESEIEKVKVDQFREVKINLPFQEAINLCLEAIEQNEKYELVKENKEEGIVEAKTGFSLRSWGAKITLNVKELDEKHSRVTINSRPKISTQIMDNHANLKNVNYLQDYLAEHS